MKHTYKILFVVFAVTSVILTGCNLDINEDPNRVTETTISGSLIFPAAAHETGQRIASGNFTFLNNWLGYWSGSGSFAIDQTETTYNITTSFGNTLWANQYNTLFDLEQARAKSLEAGDTVLAGASMILAARLWQDVVDIFGNVPYSQAFQYSKYPTPAYDKAQDIYNDLQLKLDQAIDYMGATGKSTFASLDIVNKGDKTKWIKFANTLKLRLLIRQSEIPGFSPTAEITKIIAKGGVLHSGETVSVNPGYTNATNKQSPFYANYGKTVNNADAAPSVKANTYLVDLFDHYSDNRVYFDFDSVVTKGEIVPTTYGLTAGNPLTASGVGPGLANNPGQDQWIFTSVESMFLEAEAIARGWIAGDDEKAFKDAVTESFIFLGVEFKGKKKDKSDSIVSPSIQASYYLDSLTDNAPITDYAAISGGTTIQKVKFIIFQKYLALAGIAPIEAWSDLRRLGFDILPTTLDDYITENPAKVSPTIPIRLLYPQSEYTSNGTNVSAEGNIDAFNTKLFWDVN